MAIVSAVKKFHTVQETLLHLFGPSVVELATCWTSRMECQRWLHHKSNAGPSPWAHMSIQSLIALERTKVMLMPSAVCHYPWLQQLCQSQVTSCHGHGLISIRLCQSIPEQDAFSVDAHSRSWLEVVPVSAAMPWWLSRSYKQFLQPMDYLRESLRMMKQCSPVSNSRTSFMEMVLYIHKLLPTPCIQGLAEWSVQTFKQGIKSLREGTVETKSLWFLLKYRLTPRTTTGHSPAELLLGRQPRSRLDLLHPDVSGRVQESQARQQRAHSK